MIPVRTNNFADPLTFIISSNFNVFNTLVYNQICKTTEILISLCCTVCLVLISKCWHAITITEMVNTVNIIPARHQYVSTVTVSLV